MRIPWRLTLLAVLVLAPIFFLIGVGVYHLWTTGWTFTAWWPMALCLASAYGLAWYWTRRRSKAMLPDPNLEPIPKHWTDRDREAWKGVEAYVDKVESLDMDHADDLNLYFNQGRELADLIGKIYHPAGAPPYTRLTIPEILACVELVTRDMGRRTDAYLPGNHYWTIGDYTRARRAIDWYGKARNAYWLVSGLINPLKAGSQYVAGRYGFAKPLDKLKNNALTWFHQAFLFEVGRHCIELFSGRLKMGSTRFQAALAGAPLPDGVPVENAPGLRIVVVGEAGAGKSSLVQSVIRASGATSYSAEMDAGETRFRLILPGMSVCTIVDRVGYAATGEEGFNAIIDRLEQADLVVMATAAERTERANDLKLLGQLKARFAAQPHLLRPPVVVALTRMGEEMDAEAKVAEAKSLFGEQAVAVVPLSTQAGSPHTAAAALLPALAEWADEAQGGAALKHLHSPAYRRGIRSFAKQAARSVGATVRAALTRRASPNA